MLPKPSAPPLSPVHAYAVPVAASAPLRPPPPPPPPPPPRTAPSDRRVAVQVHTEDSFCPSVWTALWFASHVLAYHVANACVGLAGLLLVVLGLTLSLLLLPLCGFGLVVLSVTATTAYQLSWFDAKMHNTIPLDASETIVFPEEDAERRPLLPVYDPTRATRSSRTNTPPPRFADEELRRFSPRALSLLVYFGVVKPVTGMLCVLNLVFLVAFAMSLVSDGFHLSMDVDWPTEISVDSSEWSALDGVIGAAACAVFLHVITRVSLAATRFFCCERS